MFRSFSYFFSLSTQPRKLILSFVLFIGGGFFRARMFLKSLYDRLEKKKLSTRTWHNIWGLSSRYCIYTPSHTHIFNILCTYIITKYECSNMDLAIY